MYITEKNLFKIALFFNSIYIFLFFLFSPQGISVSKILITSFLLFSFVVFVFLSLRNKKSLNDIPYLAKYAFYLLMFWGIVTVSRGFSLSIQDWVTNLGNVYMGLAWLMPILILLGHKIEYWNIIIKVIFTIFKLLIVSFLIVYFSMNLSVEYSWLLRPVCFLILIGLYRYKLINKIIIFLILTIYLITAIKVDIRVDFMYLFLVFSFILIDSIKQIKIKRSFLKYILFSFIILLCIVFTVGYETLSNFVAQIIDFQDSRTFLFQELFQELSPIEKIFGRGSLGTYYSHYFEHTKWYIVEILHRPWWGDSSTRITTEVGYLQMILKGGLIMLILNLFLMTYATYLALFKSNNRFVKRLGFYILILIILSLISFRPAFIPTFIILWIAIGTVLSKKNRQMGNEEIENLIKFK
ncbi:MAG: hypothetical protein R2812_10475 [Gelidibacter sp.]